MQQVHPEEQKLLMVSQMEEDQIEEAMFLSVSKRDRNEDYYSDDSNEIRVEKSSAHDFEGEDWKPVHSNFQKASDLLQGLSNAT